MPKMQIYKGGIEFGSKKFHSQFMICRASHEKHRLFWQADDEEVEPGGGVQIWIRCFESKSMGKRFDICAVLPTWQLTVDGIPQEQRLYDEFEVTGKGLELRYGDYRFVCSFPPFKDERNLREE